MVLSPKTLDGVSSQFSHHIDIMIGSISAALLGRAFVPPRERGSQANFLNVVGN